MTKKLLVSFFLLLGIYNSVRSQSSYYSINNGNYSSNIWSASCHTCVTCSCAPSCNIPPNKTIYIKHAVTSTCTTLDIGSNSTFILLPGGSFSLLGNGSVTGTGSLSVANGASLTVTGNLSFSGGGDATISGYVNVSGTVSINSAGSSVCGTGTLIAGALVGNPCGSLSLVVLPVELTDFSAECISKGVQLNWSTISEENNDFFFIESSKDGLNWNEVAKVKGSGTVGYLKKYIHTDFITENGLRYYRLSQIDFDKTKKTLRVIDLNCNNVKNEMILFPNPSSTELNILLNVSQAENNGVMKLYNFQGQLVFENQIQLNEGSNSFSFPIELQPGTYHAVFTSDKVNIPAQKIIIIKP